MNIPTPWIVVGIVVLAIVVLVATLLALAGHVRTLGLAVRRTRLRAEQAQKLQAKIEDTQVRIAGLQEKVAVVSATADELRAKRAAATPD